MRHVHQAPWHQDQSQTLNFVRDMAINEIQMQKTEDSGVLGRKPRIKIPHGPGVLSTSALLQCDFNIQLPARNPCILRVTLDGNEVHRQTLVFTSTYILVATWKVRRGSDPAQPIRLEEGSTSSNTASASSSKHHQLL